MQLVIGLCFHSTAIKDVDHDELSLALLIEFRQPGADTQVQQQRCQPSFTGALLLHLGATVVNHRSQEALLLHLGATVFYELSCLSGLQTFRLPS